MRTQEKTLAAAEFCGDKKGAPRIGAECQRDGKRQRGNGRGGEEHVPAAAHRQHQRDQQAELRLVGEEADEHAGDERPAVELRERAGEKRGGEKAISGMAEIDEHRRMGEGDEGPERVFDKRTFSCRAKNAAYGSEIKRQRYALPQQQRQLIRHCRQQAGEAKRRVMPAVELSVRTEDRLLADILWVRVKGRGNVALQHITAGGIDVGKIGAERPAETVVEPVGRGDQEAGAHDGGDQQGERLQPHLLAGQLASGAEGLAQGGQGRGG